LTERQRAHPCKTERQRAHPCKILCVWPESNIALDRSRAIDGLSAQVSNTPA
jgi:hypothetical protein